jgi:hypothetical protein
MNGDSDWAYKVYYKNKTKQKMDRQSVKK